MSQLIRKNKNKCLLINKNCNMIEISLSNGSMKNHMLFLLLKGNIIRKNKSTKIMKS